MPSFLLTKDGLVHNIFENIRLEKTICPFHNKERMCMVLDTDKDNNEKIILCLDCLDDLGDLFVEKFTLITRKF